MYAFPCILEMLLVYYYLKELDKDVREFDMQLDDRKMSYEVYAMMGANAENTIISIKDGNMFQRLTGIYANMTTIHEKQNVSLDKNKNAQVNSYSINDRF